MITCKEYVAVKKEELKNEIAAFERQPCLAVVQVGNDPASNSYIKGKNKDCSEVGINMKHCHVENYESFSQADLEALVLDLNNDKNIDGIIVQLPIPDKYNVEEVQKCIRPEKDVDGFRRDSCFEPCTPKGIINWLEYNDFYFLGTPVVVAGRSKIVGKPLVNMLIDRGATVTCINSKTWEPHGYTFDAMLFISAIGKPKYWTHGYFNKNMCSVIVDVGINRDKNGKLCGDVDTTDFNEYLPDTYCTPVPGSVGLLTREVLLENTVEAYKLNGGKQNGGF